MAEIIKLFPDKLVVVVSAMGKTTNALEAVAQNYFNRNQEALQNVFKEVKIFHDSVLNELFTEREIPVFSEIEKIFSSLEERFTIAPSINFDFEYDQIVSYGEQLSTKIINAYLQNCGINSEWIDIRSCIYTDSTWREAKVDWELSQDLVPRIFNFKASQIYITQGFIGSTTSNQTTTLGREGSDYTAAILGNMLDAEDVSIWKDVPGILNADPQYFKASQKLEKMSYNEAVELSFYGAKVIHPKTIKPLVEKSLPLFVRSFIEPSSSGTTICKVDYPMEYIPMFILRKEQVLVTISPKDFSFMEEGSISKIYSLFAKYRIKVRLVQQSAITFSASVDRPESGFGGFVNELDENFVVKYNEHLELLTIRYYNEEVVKEHTQNRAIYLEQKSRRTARFLLRE